MSIKGLDARILVISISPTIMASQHDSSSNRTTTATRNHPAVAPPQTQSDLSELLLYRTTPVPGRYDPNAPTVTLGELSGLGLSGYEIINNIVWGPSTVCMECLVQRGIQHAFHFSDNDRENEEHIRLHSSRPRVNDGTKRWGIMYSISQGDVIRCPGCPRSYV